MSSDERERLAPHCVGSGQIEGLRRLLTELTERNRRESLQLLRVQNDLNQPGLAMRDMLDTETRYPLLAWSGQFERIRRDLDDALSRQGAAAVTGQAPEQRQELASAVQQLWDAADLTTAGLIDAVGGCRIESAHTRAVSGRYRTETRSRPQHPQTRSNTGAPGHRQEVGGRKPGAG